MARLAHYTRQNISHMVRLRVIFTAINYRFEEEFGNACFKTTAARAKNAVRESEISSVLREASEAYWQRWDIVHALSVSNSPMKQQEKRYVACGCRFLPLLRASVPCCMQREFTAAERGSIAYQRIAIERHIDMFARMENQGVKLKSQKESFVTVADSEASSAMSATTCLKVKPVRHSMDRGANAGKVWLCHLC